jgi:hypothetical protein
MDRGAKVSTLEIELELPNVPPRKMAVSE